MKQLITIGRLLATTLLLGLFASAAHAQATRTWVSGVGDDANPCSRTAPCKTFAGAISKTATGGIINAIDPGGFGAVTITKAITIDGGGTLASILAAGTNGVIINVPSVNDKVTLRNLTIDGVGTGLNGIRLITSGTLIVEDCVIDNFIQKGIDLQPTGAAQVVINDTAIRGNNGASGGGIQLLPGAVGSVSLSADNVKFSKNLFAMQVNQRGTAVVRNSSATNNDSFAFKASSTGGNALLTLDNATISENAGAAVFAIGNGASVTLSRSALFNNASGMGTSVSGKILTFGDNRNTGNTTNGAPTDPVIATQ